MCEGEFIGPLTEPDRRFAQVVGSLVKLVQVDIEHPNAQMGSRRVPRVEPTVVPKGSGKEAGVVSKPINPAPENQFAPSTGWLAVAQPAPRSAPLSL